MACIHVKHNRAIRAVHTKKGLVFCWLLCLLAHWVPPPTIACLHTPKTPLPLFLPTCVCWLTSHLLKPHCPPPTCLFLLQQPPPEPKVHMCKPNQANNRSRPRQGVCALLTHTEMQHPSESRRPVACIYKHPILPAFTHPAPRLLPPQLLLGAPTASRWGPEVQHPHKGRDPEQAAAAIIAAVAAQDMTSSPAADPQSPSPPPPGPPATPGGTSPRAANRRSNCACRAVSAAFCCSSCAASWPCISAETWVWNSCVCRVLKQGFKAEMAGAETLY